MLNIKYPFKRVLVTGGAGFIGTRIVNLLKEMGKEICVVDNLYIGRPMPESGPKILTFTEDIGNQPVIEKIFKSFNPEVVIHLAAIHHIPTCEKNGPQAMQTNVVGTQIILDAAQTVHTKLCILASTGAVYQWDTGFLKEDHTQTGACDNYSVTKLTNEQQLKVWTQKTGSRGRIARLFNTIGHDDPNGHLIPDIMQQILDTPGNVEISLGNIKAKRDYIYVQDTAEGILSVLNDLRENIALDTFNICTGMEFSVSDIVNEIGLILNKKIAICIDEKRLRKLDRDSQLGDPTKSTQMLGFKARYDFKNAIRQTITPFVEAFLLRK